MFNKCKLIFFFCAFVLQGTAQNSLEALKTQLQNSKHDTTRCELINQLIEIAPDGEWQSYNSELQKISLNNIKQRPAGRLLFLYLKYYSESLHNQGIIYSEQSDDEKAVEYFNKSISISRKSNNQLGMAMSMQSIAQIDIRKGNNTKALNLLYDCLKTFEQYQDEIGIADVHLSIGDICFLQKDFKKAIEHHTTSYNLYQKNKYDVAMGTISYKVGVDYFEAKDYAKALDYLQKSIDLFQSSDYGANTVAYLNIAQIFIYQKNYDKALEFSNQGLKIAEAIQNKLEIAHSYFLFSKIYTLQNKKNLAVEYAEKSLKISQEIEHPSEINAASKHLYDLYTELKQEAKAKRVYEIYLDSKKSVDNQESKNALLEQKLKYEYEKKELLSKAENDKQLAALQTETERKNLIKNIWLTISGVIILLVIVIALFSYRHFKQKSIITNQKNNLLKQKLLVSQMNPHFIFNSLNAIQNYIFKQDSLKAGTYLTQFSELIRMILDFSRKDYISVESECKLLNNYLELQKLRFENKFDYSITIDEKIDREEILIPPMLAQPFIENAIEHGIFHKDAHGRVDVRLFFDKEYLIYEIEDNGIGLEEAMKLKNKLKSSYESLATVITKERMSNLSEQLNHKVEIEIIDKKTLSDKETGVKVKFIVPFKEA